jgi:hypothetical protein
LPILMGKSRILCFCQYPGRKYCPCPLFSPEGVW